MPRTPSDYSKTIIYKLCCKDVAITEIYVGSTTNFRDRKRCHKLSCNLKTHNAYNTRKAQFIRANGGFENWTMIQLDVYPCQNKREAEMRERYWIETLQATLNSMIPFKTEEEIKEQQKEYRELNKEQITEQKKEYRELNKEQIAEQKKEYEELNKQKIKERKRQYYLNKKENKKCSDII